MSFYRRKICGTGTKATGWWWSIAKERVRKGYVLREKWFWVATPNIRLFLGAERFIRRKQNRENTHSSGEKSSLLLFCQFLENPSWVMQIFLLRWTFMQKQLRRKSRKLWPIFRVRFFDNWIKKNKDFIMYW